MKRVCYYLLSILLFTITGANVVTAYKSNGREKVTTRVSLMKFQKLSQPSELMQFSMTSMAECIAPGIKLRNSNWGPTSFQYSFHFHCLLHD